MSCAFGTFMDQAGRREASQRVLVVRARRHVAPSAAYRDVSRRADHFERPSKTLSTKIGPKALAAEKARLGRFFQTINKHRKALDLAIEENFGGALDSTEWRNAFDSTEPRDANRTMVVTGDHSAMLNAYVEILKAAAGSRLIGLLPYRRPHAEQVFQALLVDNGLTKAQVEMLNGLYILEGRLEHASPDVDAEEVRDAVERLREALPELVESAAAWLHRHGVELQ